MGQNQNQHSVDYKRQIVCGARGCIVVPAGHANIHKIFAGTKLGGSNSGISNSAISNSAKNVENSAPKISQTSNVKISAHKVAPNYARFYNSQISQVSRAQDFSMNPPKIARKKIHFEDFAAQNNLQDLHLNSAQNSQNSQTFAPKNSPKIDEISPKNLQTFSQNSAQKIDENRVQNLLKNRQNFAQNSLKNSLNSTQNFSQNSMPKIAQNSPNNLNNFAPKIAQNSTQTFAQKIEKNAEKISPNEILKQVQNDKIFAQNSAQKIVQNVNEKNAPKTQNFAENSVQNLLKNANLTDANLAENVFSPFEPLPVNLEDEARKLAKNHAKKAGKTRAEKSAKRREKLAKFRAEMKQKFGEKRAEKIAKKSEIKTAKLDEKNAQNSHENLVKNLAENSQVSAREISQNEILKQVQNDKIFAQNSAKKTHENRAQNLTEKLKKVAEKSNENLPEISRENAGNFENANFTGKVLASAAEIKTAENAAPNSAPAAIDNGGAAAISRTKNLPKITFTFKISAAKIFGFLRILAILTILGVSGYLAWDTWMTNRSVEETFSNPAAAISIDATNPATADPTSISEQQWSTYNVPADQPRYISIPSLNINSRVMSVGVTTKGNIDTPKNLNDTAWYDGSAKPGQDGEVFINGHTSFNSGLAAAFNALPKIENGAQITIEKGNGEKVNYKVVAKETVAADKVDMSKALNTPENATKGLTLMTCAGKFDYKTQNASQRLVVYAVQE